MATPKRGGTRGAGAAIGSLGPQLRPKRWGSPVRVAISGVEVRPLSVIHDERGHLMEIVRSDDPWIRNFGQVYATSCRAGVVKAWHLHREQSDAMACVAGTLKIALFDDREDSPTRGAVQVEIIGDRRPALVVVPPGIYHGFTAIGGDALVVNVPDRVYNRVEPDEFRVPARHPAIPFDWFAEVHG